MDRRFFGYVCRLAFDTAKSNKLSNSFNPEKKAAGKKWFRALIKRRPHLSLRTP